MSAPWLVVVDAQRVFADPASPWYSPGMTGESGVLPRITALAGAYGGRTVRTRFVAPSQPTGAWVEYYEQWPFAVVAPDDPLYDLVDEVAGLAGPVVTRTTFGKWDDAPDGLAALTGGHLLLTGVSTDCCVLSTALAAADAGARVEVVVDACAGATPADHDRALAAMELYAPLVTLTTTDEVLARGR